ncbi:MAG: hypothetical protein GC200_07640 [Tepidisphaera sp.]|nr:hypothetical protein [Tepidisphaera sp.]
MKLQKTLAFVTCAAAGMALVASAQAGDTYTTILPTYSGAFSVAGNNTDAAPGFGPGSFQASTATQSKSELYIPASQIFNTTVHINDIQSISYWTNKGTTAADPDWTFYIYTAPTGADDTASWYKSRLNSEPYFTGTTGVAANTWHQWSTGDATNPMRFYDQARSGNFGTYTDPTLAALQSGAVTWGNNASRDYGSEVVNIISLQTGSAWANGFAGLVDGVTITLNNGDSAYVNLVPAPGAAAAMGMLGLVGLRRRR